MLSEVSERYADVAFCSKAEVMQATRSAKEAWELRPDRRTNGAKFKPAR